MQISIIIPVKNAEAYLERCLDSILKSLKKAGNKKAEILLVDNGSTDNTPKIEQAYAKNYSFIKILNCKTPGAAAAKNLGSQHAHAKYFWFIDADDTITETAITKILEKTHQNPDLIMLGADKLDKNGHKIRYFSPVDETKPDYKSRFIRYGMGPWQVVIKANWWREHNFKFPEGIIHEDMALMSILILYTDHLTHIDQPLYHYYETANSVLHSQKWDKKYFDIFPALEYLHAGFKAAHADQTYEKELEWFFIWNLLIDSAADFKKFKQGRPGFVKSRAILKRYYPHWRHNPFLHTKPWKLKLLVRMNYYGINKPKI